MSMNLILYFKIAHIKFSRFFFVIGDDELHCDSCSDHEFKCGTGECINLAWHCDGQMDCTDRSDEFNCTNVKNSTVLLEHYNPTCSENEFKCKNEKCAEWDRVCNNLEDGCADGSDEGGNCATACRNSPCEQRCLRSPNGPVCA